MIKLFKNQIVLNILKNNKNFISTLCNKNNHTHHHNNNYNNNHYKHNNNNNNNLITCINRYYTSANNNNNNNINRFKIEKGHFDNLRSVKFNQPIPKDVCEIQEILLNSNEDQLSIYDKINHANYLFQIEKINKTHINFDKNVLNKVWSLLDINRIDISRFPEENKLSSIFSFICTQIKFAFESKSLLPRAKTSVELYIDTLEKLEKSGRVESKQFFPMTALVFLAASHIGMWKEMVHLYSKVDPNEIKNLSDGFTYSFNYDAIYKMITSIDPLLKVRNPVYDITKPSKQINDNEFKHFKVYNTTQEIFKDFKKTIIGEIPPLDHSQISNFFTSRVIEDMNELEKKGRKTNAGIISYAPSTFIFLGTAVGMDIKYLIMGGIVSFDFKRIQLYSDFYDNENLVEHQYDLDIISNENGLITLNGNLKIIETLKNNSKIILETDVLFFLKEEIKR